MPLLKSPRTALPKLTDRLALGEVGLRVSPFCLGMVSSPDTVCAAFDAGINFFFLSADMHWLYYEEARRGLEKLLARGGNVREQIVVAVVSYVAQREFCSMPFEEVIEAVAGLGEIDVAVIGGAYADNFAARLPIYQEHRRTEFAGVKALGATFHDRTLAVGAVNQNLVDIAFIRYNPSHAGARTDVFPHLRQPTFTLLYNFKSTLGYVSPARSKALGLSDDHWQSKITDHYRFALTRPGMDGVLCAPQTPAQVAALAKAMKAGPLTEEEEQYLMGLAALAEGRARLE